MHYTRGCSLQHKYECSLLHRQSVASQPDWQCKHLKCGWMPKKPFHSWLSTFQHSNTGLNPPTPSTMHQHWPVQHIFVLVVTGVFETWVIHYSQTLYTSFILTTLPFCKTNLRPLGVFKSNECCHNFKLFARLPLQSWSVFKPKIEKFCQVVFIATDLGFNSRWTSSHPAIPSKEADWCKIDSNVKWKT